MMSKTIDLQAGPGVATPQDEHQRDERQHQIPVTDKLGEDDGEEAALVGKLGEHRHRRATARVLEIDRIHQVHRQCHGIGDDKQPLESLVNSRTLLEVQR